MEQPSSCLAELRPAAALVGAAVRFAPEQDGQGDAVDALIDAAFGPGRYAKTAERLREGSTPLQALSICAWSGSELAGAVRLWPIRIGATQAVFLGPIAVDQRWRKHGIGAALVERACEAAAQAGEQLVLLVGDPPFFGPLGFQRAPAGVKLPGPVDPVRLLWRALAEGTDLGVEGRVAPDRSRLEGQG